MSNWHYSRYDRNFYYLKRLLGVGNWQKATSEQIQQWDIIWPIVRDLNIDTSSYRGIQLYNTVTGEEYKPIVPITLRQIRALNAGIFLQIRPDSSRKNLKNFLGKPREGLL